MEDLASYDREMRRAWLIEATATLADLTLSKGDRLSERPSRIKMPHASASEEARCKKDERIHH